jgi:predicted nucleic acid-binding protein
VNVFSNTTPFIALSSIKQLDLLPRLFNQVYVAESVIKECAEGGRILVPDLRALEWIVAVEDEPSAGLPFLFELDRG